MKTTVEIAEPVLERAKRYARNENTTLKAIIDEALRAFLDAPPIRSGFVLQDRSVPGRLSPEFVNATWDQIRDEIYQLEAFPVTVP